jgi:hypothetical protein
MIVQRLEMKAKRGHINDLLALFKEGNAMLEATRTKRVYVSQTGGDNRVVIEWEWENLAHYEKSWAAFYALPSWPAFGAKWNALVEDSGHDLWVLKEV